MRLETMFVASQDTDTHRFCGSCNTLKPIDQFYKDGKDSEGKTRYRRDCKECYAHVRYAEAQNRKENKK